MKSIEQAIERYEQRAKDCEKAGYHLEVLEEPVIVTNRSNPLTDRIDRYCGHCQSALEPRFPNEKEKESVQRTMNEIRDFTFDI